MFWHVCAVSYKAMAMLSSRFYLPGNCTWLQETHHCVQLYPVDLVAGADSRLLGLQCVWEGAHLEHQEVESF